VSHGWRLLLRPAGGLLDLLLPPSCSLCGELLDHPGRSICPTCAFGFDPLDEPLCARCGAPLTAGGCPDCLRFEPRAQPIRSGFALGGACLEAVLALKTGRSELAADLAERLAACRSLGPAVAGADRLLPVPLHPRRQRRRGFNQAALLARRLAARLGLRLEPAALVRRRHTPAQRRRDSRAERLRNVHGAFAVRRPERVAGLALCLVDDVVTTGATLTACADALLAAGARSVRAVTLARTLRQHQW
jgi:ComF family protein